MFVQHSEKSATNKSLKKLLIKLCKEWVRQFNAGEVFPGKPKA